MTTYLFRRVTGEHIFAFFFALHMKGTTEVKLLYKSYKQH